MKSNPLIFPLIVFIFFACSKENTEPELNYELGKNRFTTEIDGDFREYYVHVPVGYDENNPTPVVFMLHGASGQGLGTYNTSGWKELGETENFISVFPTAWSYCWIKKNGVLKDTTRWNSYPGQFDFCIGEIPRDDINFLRQIITELHQKFNVDAKRIYMAGFSSGGQMAYRCAVEMSDILAAIVQSGGTYQIDTIVNPIRNLPMTFELGNEDATWFENGLYPPLTLFDTLLTNYWLFRQIVKAHTNNFDYDTSYSISGDPDIALVASFQSIPKGEDREFNFVLIDGLDHSYPNGSNHPFYGAQQHWGWMKQFTLP